MKVQSCRIAVIEDDYTLGNYIKSFLIQEGFEVDAYSSGKVFLDKEEEHKFEYGLIVSDFNMPEITGLDLFNLMYEKGLLNNIPFLFISAIADQSEITDIIRDKSVLAVDFLEKPFKLFFFRNRIKMMLKLKNYRNILQNNGWEGENC